MIYNNKYYLEDNVRITSQKNIHGVIYKLQLNIGFKYLPIWNTIDRIYASMKNINSKEHLISIMRKRHEDYLEFQKKKNKDVLT